MENQTTLFDLAMHTGELLLENGAETYRIEETITRMCRSRGVDSDCFATPSVIILSGLLDGEHRTLMRRVRTKRLDLHLIEELNDFARTFAQGDIPLEQAMRQLEQVAIPLEYAPWVQIVAGGITAAFFSNLFGAGWTSLPVGFGFGVILKLFLMVTEPFRLNFFLRNLLAGFFITLVIHLSALLVKGLDSNALIIGTIMQLVPGVAITNSVRDTLSGDFLSGMTRASEAMFIALGIAFGVGVSLMLMRGIGL